MTPKDAADYVVAGACIAAFVGSVVTGFLGEPLTALWLLAVAAYLRKWE